MAFNTTQLKADIKAAFDKESDNNVNPAEARDRMADGISKAIEKYLKAIKVAADIPVSTTGSSTAQTGFTTAQGSLE